jgi:hypothetical protein
MAPFPPDSEATVSAEAAAGMGILTAARAEIESNGYATMRAGDVKIERMH